VKDLPLAGSRTGLRPAPAHRCRQHRRGSGTKWRRAGYDRKSDR
jgi:hypothetical protein